MKITISRQLTLMAVMAILMLAIVGVIGNQVASSIEAAADYSEKNTVPSVEEIALMRLTFVEIREAVLSHDDIVDRG